MKLFYILLLLLFNVLNASEINVSSIITLENNIPSKCGINFQIMSTENYDVSVVIKKDADVGTLTSFSVSSLESKIRKANIVTSSENINSIIKMNNLSKKDYFVESASDENATAQFFQELLISGANIIINKKKYEVIGPIDSKVRLEYLFCTGEMFLPNYEKNKQ
tara:strand:- start:1483 stop:1977 length:495 start_codon:yes stop_codon:yes gene_type:complete